MTPIQKLERNTVECFRRHPRSRHYALDAQSIRELCAIFESCIDTGSKDAVALFYNALEELTDTFGSTLLRPKPKEPRNIPVVWLNPVTNEPLPNPWQTKDEKGKRVLAQHDSELAELYEQIAADPYGTTQRLREEERRRVRANELESEYNAIVHSHNPFANPNATEVEKAEFATLHPEHTPIYQREAKPPRARVFGKNPNRTICGRILRNDAELWNLIKRAEEHNLELEQEAERQAQREREEAEAKLAELRHKTAKLGDGRTITFLR